MQEKEIIFLCCTMINQQLFFIENDGVPAKMNPESGDVSYCDMIDNFALRRETIKYYDIQTFDDKVYALGVAGDNIIIFDLEKCRCQYIPLQCTYRRYRNFVAFEQYDSNFYIFPRYENKIYILNTVNNEITEDTEYFAGATEFQCACRTGKKIWLIPCDANVIGCYDLSNQKIQIYKMQRKIDNCADAVFINESIYILNRFGIIYIWNMQKRKIEEVKILKTEQSEEKFMYGKMVHAGNKLIILPSLAEEIKTLDILTGKVETYDGYPEDFLYYDKEYMTNWSKYAGLCEDNNYYYCAMRKGNYLLKIRKKDGVLLWLKPNIPPKEEKMKILNPLKEERFKNAFAAGERFFLESDVNIGSFLKAVFQKKYIAEKTNIGEMIFKAIKE